MSDIHSQRLSRLRKRMAATNTDLIALGPSSHMVWLSGLNPHGDERPVMLLITQDYAGLLMPALNAASARQHTLLPFHEWSDADGPELALSELLTHCGGDKSGLSVVIDETMRADFALRLLDSLSAPHRRFTDDTVGLLRASKDSAEFDALKASALLNDAAVREAFTMLKVGATESDVQSVIHGYYKTHGAQPEFTIVGFGANGAFPHHHSGETKLEQNMAVLIDTGCRLHGYPSDMTRCGWFGTPSAEYNSVFTVLERAVQAALDAARPGVKASDVDRAARDVINAAGYGERFLHRTGHGLGIDIHEPPYIAANSGAVLAEGNVFSIEPGIYLDGQFGIRLEDIVILRRDGPEVLSALTRDTLRLTG